MLTVVYRSEAMSLLPFSALADICLLSAKKNQRLGITGFLVEFEGIFLQVLEGEREKVNALYRQISADPRHHNVELLACDQTDARPNFGFWAMNFGPLNNAMFWNAVLGPKMGAEEFRQRSHDPEFALEVLSRAYIHACTIADVDPVFRDFVIGTVPRFDGALMGV